MTRTASGANPSARRRRLPTPEEFERARKASATSSHHQAQCQSTFGDNRLRRSSRPVVNEPGANCVQEQQSIRHDDIVTDKLAKAAIPETTMMHSKITRSQNAVPQFTEPPSDDPEPVASRKRGRQDNGNEQDRGHHKRSRVCVAPAEERLQPDQMQSAGPLAILPDPNVSRKRGRQDGDGSSTSQSFQAGNRPHKRRNLAHGAAPQRVSPGILATQHAFCEKTLDPSSPRSGLAHYIRGSRCQRCGTRHRYDGGYDDEIRDIEYNVAG
ncbi:hypothetical protein WOLCODRAFT_155295 [Wolfiporia cocos MD-104 SS10]|uniref:Uncharacterized protein n=1 Tax=Wolfiporia cocos (strain MD-104) TaxID=742152 RepID=A0A2H3J4D5_WOLCO|nr:hypothetical protein WOLCODRAFT_155295 [Wolfiporia cocos MD-104 SS10]